MIQRFSKVRKHEWRTVFLLGSFTFVMLAATTLVSAASDALFVASYGAERLAQGIAVGQIATIIGFTLYRWVRRKVATMWVNPVVTISLSAMMIGLVVLLQQGIEEAIFAMVVVAPFFAGVLGSEYGRLSASMIDARSARRLLPILGAIGGAGASLGALAMSYISAAFETYFAIAAAAALLLLLMLPAMFIKESQTPRVTTNDATPKDVFSHRFATIVLLGGAVMIAITTIVRILFGAMVTEQYSGSDVGVFYADFYYWLNLVSIGFALFGTNLIIKMLGAARTLFIYPLMMSAVAFVGTQLPAMLLASGLQFAERLLRQNVHNTAATIVNMPVPVPIRIRQALLSSGSVKPLAVLLTTGLLFATFGDNALIAPSLTWQQLYWPVGVLGILLTGMVLYLTRNYPNTLRDALHSRRLQVSAVDDLGDAQFLATIDGHAEKTLLQYLGSEHPERVALALQLLQDHSSDAVCERIEKHWAAWDDWLKKVALRILVNHDSEQAAALVDRIMLAEDAAIQAETLRLTGSRYTNAELWEMVQNPSAPAGHADAIYGLLAERADPILAQKVEHRQPGESSDFSLDSLATVLASWPDDRYDDLIPQLLEHDPVAGLRVIKNRPAARWATRCTELLRGRDTRVLARTALENMGEDAVASLEAQAQLSSRYKDSYQLLSLIEGQKAHLAGMRLMGHAHRPVRTRASKARLSSPFTISSAEASLARENGERALAVTERFHSYMLRTEGLQQSIARSERDAALEDLFLNLTLADRSGPFRQIFLALTNRDQKQKALAMELLEAHAPKSFARRLEPVLEDIPVSGQFDMQADREWLQLEERLEAKATADLSLRDLKSNHAFQDWRVAELEALADLSSSEFRPVPIVLRDHGLVDPETTILTGQAPAEIQDNDLQLPLDQVYATFEAAPRCGHLWLQTLAQRIPAEAIAQTEITRSAMVSLASRAVADDHAQADDHSIWQRMFFLRSSDLGQNLPPDRLKLLAQISKSLSAAAGQVVTHERRLGHHFYLLCTGAAEVTQGGQMVSKLGPSEGFGALALIQGMRRPMTVTLTQPSELIAISRIDFLDLLELHPELVRSFARNIADQILSLRG